ncbi:NRDE family protein [Kitasatospora sp. NBC_01287]|uniref:NRDE family protein n=1 Tax=Kitasatospora sp. NBC_01287 TaxID=2903573 RepID=UPI002B1E1AED|nr:NRDE family protein [Kitasatospora sp. NBC_01287]
MCTAFISIAPGSAVPVLLLAVRDEYTDRQWLPPGRHWASRPSVTGGLDLTAGGTWLAVTPGSAPGTEAVAACLLNGFGRSVPQQRLSRGGIPLIAAGGQVLTSSRMERYDPFHLILARPSGVRVISWSGSSMEEHELPAGLSVVLNDGLEGRTGGRTCSPHIRSTMSARASHFRARLQAAARPEPADGPPADAWGDWLPIACGDDLPLDDPAALIRRLRSPGGRVWGAVSISMVALAPTGVRYDFGAVVTSASSTRITLKPVLVSAFRSRYEERADLHQGLRQLACSVSCPRRLRRSC